MKIKMKKALLLFAALFAAHALYSQTKEAKEVYSVDEMRQDFYIFRASLEEGIRPSTGTGQDKNCTRSLRPRLYRSINR